MLSSRAIFQLLINEEQPEPPIDPTEPSGPGPDDIDPKSEILRYANEKPFPIPGDGPGGNTYNYFLAKLNGRPRRKVKNNTYLINLGDRIALKLHSTNVLEAFPDNKIEVDTGGWETRTTADRINHYLRANWRTYSQKGEWCWYNTVSGAGGYKDVYKYVFTAGDTILPDGSLQLLKHPVPVRRRRVKV